jgi:hypothetical protein
VPPKPKAAVAWIVWIDHSATLRRRLELTNELTEPPHYEVDLYFAGQGADGGIGPSGPSFAVLDEALAWAAARSDKVIVRPSWDPLTSYVASDGPSETWSRHG